ncbi:MAG: hypothetical protein ACRC3H_23735 [Lachnospiraceae bacterium]
MTQPKTWEEFRDSGMLWFVNTILHAFGWAIMVDIDEEGKVIGGYPGRVKFRGFSEDDNDKGYEKVARYMKENAKVLYDEAEYEEARGK